MRNGRATLSLVFFVVTGFTWAQRGPGSLQITVPNSAMQVSSNQQLTVKRIFQHAPSRAVTVPARWSSSDQTIATVDGTGKVTATASTGTAFITAVSGPFNARIPVVVIPSGTFTAL